MENIIKDVHAVFGNECPSRSYYSSRDDKPFPALDIMKAFKTWAKFELAYNIEAIQKRNETSKTIQKVVKPAKISKVGKNVIK